MIARLLQTKVSIQIGDGSLIGPNLFCVESDLHPFDPTQRLTSNYDCQSVKIGKNVFIGACVAIFKDVNIGDDAVIAAGSVIIKDVLGAVVVTGNTAKFICDLKPCR